MRDFYSVADTAKQQELSNFSLYNTHQLYKLSRGLKLAYECHDGLVTTVVAEFEREVIR